MKYFLTLTTLFAFYMECFSQIELRLTKPIAKEDWIKFQDFHRNNLINDVEGVIHVMDLDGSIYKVMGNRPTNPADLVSWRPPVVPPLGYEALDPSSGYSTELNAIPNPGNAKPNPLDPGCPFCSIIIIHAKLSKSGIGYLSKLLTPYQQ